MLGTVAGRCARVALSALALALVTCKVARAGEAPKHSAGAGAKKGKVLCRIKIVDTNGLPLAPMGLLAFEDGVYRLKTEDGRKLEIPEGEVSSATFLPAGKPPRPDSREDREHREHRESEYRRPPSDRSRFDGGRRPKGFGGPDGFINRRLNEEREKLARLKQSGQLAGEIRNLERRLRAVPTSLEAASLIRRIVAATAAETGRFPSDADIRELVNTIGKADVRERMSNVPAKYFLHQFGGPRGPRR
jgi:hypothetical protein